MAKNFHKLRNKMSAEAQEKARVLAQKYNAEMPPDELRAAQVRAKAGASSRHEKLSKS